ncbi:F-box family protein [Thalictrum thalictroides]|uniref:F-box family protein n=1 Tax=Thalictrum thalictroides TaxID=46969 RepID=A0A7J6WAI5_THATH|nr:F-box family protein [Thalictrum thalictroides]
MLEIVQRYEKLQLRENFIRENYYYYPSVCKELSFILRNAYSKVPKNLQSILFQDTLAAFQFLPQVQTRYGIEAANLLLQAVEVALPKHKRGLAVTEFKHAVVAYKRRQKVHKDAEGSPQLPQDVLVHVFGFLDMRSLVVVGLVCRSWSSAANENNLWQSQYDIFFGNCIDDSKSKGQTSEPARKSPSLFNKKVEMDLIIIDWREAFKQEYIGTSSRRFASNRGYCWICKSVVWISNMKCSNVHYGTNMANQQINFLSSLQVVEFLLQDAFSIDSSSDSDSDSEESISKLWALYC